MRLSFQPDSEKARSALWFVAALSASVALLLLVALSVGLAAIYLVAAAVIAFGAWKTRPESVIGRWTAGDLLLLVAVAAVVEAYASIFGALGRSAVAASLQIVAEYVGVAAAILLIVCMRRGVKPSAFGLRLPASSIWFLVIPVFLAAAYLSSSGLQSLQSHLQPFRGLHNTQCGDIKQSFSTNLAGFVLAFPGICIAAAVVEETMFRGLLYGWLVSFAKHLPSQATLTRRLGIAAAMLASGLIFGFFHSPAYGILPILPLSAVGIVLAALYEWSGSLYPGMVTHATFNAIGLYMLLLTQNPC